MACEDGTACLAGSDASGKPVLGLLSAAGEFTAAELPADVEKVCAVSLLGGEAKAVAEAAAACFTGEITAAEATENTQRRVSEYLAGQN